MNSDKWGIGFLPILCLSTSTSTYDRERKWFRFISYLSALINESCSLHSMIARNKNALLVDWKGSFNNEKSQWFRDLALEKVRAYRSLWKGFLDARRLSCNISMNLRTIVPKAWWVLWILFSRPWFCKIRSLMKTNTWRIVASCIKGHLGPINKHSSERLYIPSFPKPDVPKGRILRSIWLGTFHDKDIRAINRSNSQPSLDLLIATFLF